MSTCCSTSISVHAKTIRTFAVSLPYFAFHTISDETAEDDEEEEGEEEVRISRMTWFALLSKKMGVSAALRGGPSAYARVRGTTRHRSLGPTSSPFLAWA